MPKPLHIGIVACTAEGAALCYRTICSEGAVLLGPHAHPEVSIHNVSFAEYLHCLNERDLEGIAEIMLQSARKLAGAGADLLICPTNSVHEAMPHVLPKSPLPWLHIAEVVATEAATRGYKRVGLTGTSWLVSSDLYPQFLEKHGVTCVRPGNRERDETNRIILDELVKGIFKAESIEYLRTVIAGFRNANCDAVVLGCTEIPLVIDDQNSPLPTLDSTRLLARAALRRAIAGKDSQ